MDITYTDADDAMAIAKKISDKLVAFMRELGIVSIKESGYTLEDCMKAADLFQYDGAFGNVPGQPGIEEVKAYIEETYNVYQ